MNRDLKYIEQVEDRLVRFRSKLDVEVTYRYLWLYNKNRSVLDSMMNEEEIRLDKLIREQMSGRLCRYIGYEKPKNRTLRVIRPSIKRRRLLVSYWSEEYKMPQKTQFTCHVGDLVLLPKEDR